MKEKNDSYQALRQDLQEATEELRCLYDNFEEMVDPNMIDYYIYQTKAATVRYQYLLGCVKKIEDSYTKNPLPDCSI